METLVIVNAPVPLFVSVTDCEPLEAPTDKLPNDKEVGERTAVGAAGATPVPLNPAVWGEPLALSATLSVAPRDPLAKGVNFTVMVQVLLAARLDPQLFVCVNDDAFAPERLTLAMVKTPVPLLVSEMV